MQPQPMYIRTKPSICPGCSPKNQLLTERYFEPLASMRLLPFLPSTLPLDLQSHLRRLLSPVAFHCGIHVEMADRTIALLTGLDLAFELRWKPFGIGRLFISKALDRIERRSFYGFSAHCEPRYDQHQ